jgi:hypothetical protein
LFSSKLVIIVMNTSQHSYFRAAALAIGLAVLFYFIALSVVANTAAALLAGTAALISGLLTPLLQCRDQDASPKKECETKKSSPATSKPATSTPDVTAIADARTLYVGNLPYRANEAAIRKLFSEYGQVISVRLVKDKETGKRRGYGFVEMPEKEAQAAIAALNETEYLQRTLKVREANEKREGTETGENEGC